MSEKFYFDVFRLEVVDIPGDEMQIGPWEFCGSTVAVSEKQAVNNVRYRLIGERRKLWVNLPKDGLLTEEWKAEKKEGRSNDYRRH